MINLKNDKITDFLKIALLPKLEGWNLEGIAILKNTWGNT